MTDKIYAKEDLVADLKAMGVCEGDLLNLKISYKSIGKVEGGPNTVIAACLEAVGPSGTIFSDSFVTPFPKWKMLICPNRCITDEHSVSYAGAIANAMVNYPNSRRSPHPTQKFVAIGAQADMVMKHNVGSRPYSVLYEMAQNGGKNIRIGPESKVVGVGTTHVAVDILGFRQNILKVGVCYRDDKGKLKRFYHCWPTSCSEAFNKLIPIHRAQGGILKDGKVGNAEAVLSDMKKTLDIEINLGKSNPHFLDCGKPECHICQLNWENSQGSFMDVLKTLLKQKRYKRIFLITYQAIFKNYQPR